MSIVAPSILAADFTELGGQVRAVAEAGADWIHVDVMDGHFVPNISIGVPVVTSLSKAGCPPLDVHLMINNPEKMIEAFARAGAGAMNNITVQVEACGDVSSVLSDIRSLGLMAGVALNPGTPFSSIENALPSADIVLVMSVEPGFSGQSFIDSSLEKIERARAVLGPAGEGVPVIEVDGGIDFEKAKAVFDAGADAVVSGSGIFGQSDIGKAVRDMKSLRAGRQND
ncbi:MAG: ribulose-phosphate 3-epimerase [Thermodesulfobacteriota bacterium]